MQFASSFSSSAVRSGTLLISFRYVSRAGSVELAPACTPSGDEFFEALMSAAGGWM